MLQERHFVPSLTRKENHLLIKKELDKEYVVAKATMKEAQNKILHIQKTQMQQDAAINVIEKRLSTL